MKSPHFEIYYNRNWYWRLRAANGKIIADGAEGYQTKAGVRKAIWRLTKTLLYAGRPLNIKEVEE